MKKAIVVLSAIIVALSAGIVFYVAGCRDQADEIPPDSFRLRTNTLVDSSDMLVRKVRIEAHGTRIVKVTEEGDSSTATIGPVRNADFMVAEIVFVAALLKTPESTNMIKWLIQIQGQGVTVGGPSTHQVEVDSLADVLDLQVDQGLHLLAEDIAIGTFRGRPIVLSVE